MKVNFVYLVIPTFLIFGIFISCNKSEKLGNEDFGIKDCKTIEPLLQTLEDKVIKASAYCLSNSENTDSLLVILNQLNSAKLKSNPEFLNYCKGFCLLHISISQMQFKQDEKADSTIMQGLDLLNGTDKKNSEIYSLLSILQGMSINYRSAMTLTVAAEKCKLYAEKAIKLNNKNPRAHLSLGIYDFYTPEVYQGGKIAESCFLKSIELGRLTDNSTDCLPKWGRDLSYRYIIRYYLKMKKTELVKKYLNEALAQFPEDDFFQKKQKELNN